MSLVVADLNELKNRAENLVTEISEALSFLHSCSRSAIPNGPPVSRKNNVRKKTTYDEKQMRDELFTRFSALKGIVDTVVERLRPSGNDNSAYSNPTTAPESTSGSESTSAPDPTVPNPTIQQSPTQEPPTQEPPAQKPLAQEPSLQFGCEASDLGKNMTSVIGHAIDTLGKARVTKEDIFYVKCSHYPRLTGHG
jgi:hypothetical protein